MSIFSMFQKQKFTFKTFFAKLVAKYMRGKGTWDTTSEQSQRCRSTPDPLNGVDIQRGLTVQAGQQSTRNIWVISYLPRQGTPHAALYGVARVCVYVCVRVDSKRLVCIA